MTLRDTGDHRSTHRGGNRIGSRTVDFWPVHEYVTARITVDTFPMAGTLAWINLPERHPQKIAAILDAAQHWALRVQLAQEALADASKDIADAADWKALSRSLHRPDSYIPRLHPRKAS